jgi:hypothetical protein
MVAQCVPAVAIQISGLVAEFVHSYKIFVVRVIVNPHILPRITSQRHLFFRGGFL